MSVIRRFIILVISFTISQIILVITSGFSAYKKQPVVERVLLTHPDNLPKKSSYKIHLFYKSEGLQQKALKTKDITLAVHSTVDRLYKLIYLTEVWTGTISYSIFVPGTNASFADDVIDGLRMCWPRIRTRVHFHLVYPVEKPANMSKTGSFVYLACKDVLRRLRKIESQHTNSIYPHNIMRNTANSAVFTDYVLHIDANIIPSYNLRQNSMKFLETRNQRFVAIFLLLNHKQVINV